MTAPRHQGGGRIARAEHGTRAEYVRGCRCPDCGQANTDYHADRRHNLGHGTYLPDSLDARILADRALLAEARARMAARS